MMEGLGQLGNLIEWPYLAIFILLSYLIITYAGAWLKKKLNWKNVYTVLIVATTIGILYFFFTDTNWVNLLLTYAIGTSFWELILKKILDKFKKK